MKNYTKTDLSKFEEIAKMENGKAFLHDALGLSSCEISVNSVPEGFALPFSHKHIQNEEVYIIIKGKGIISVDGEEIDVFEGSAVKIAPQAARTLKNTGNGDFRFICVQAKTDSLEQFGLKDAELC